MPDLQIVPVILPLGGQVWHVCPDRAPAALSFGELAALAAGTLEAAALTCYRRALERQSGVRLPSLLDVLELFAFVRPAQSCHPVPRGLAAALGIAPPAAHMQDQQGELLLQAELLRDAAAKLLRQLPPEEAPVLSAFAEVMGAGGDWPWARLIRHALGNEDGRASQKTLQQAFAPWLEHPEWEDRAPPPKPGQAPVTPQEARSMLNRLVAATIDEAAREPRTQQSDYASAITGAFQPPYLSESADTQAESTPDGITPEEDVRATHTVLAEAGTGVGKTLGYMAPAMVWAARNDAPVWVATYTRNLQQQIEMAISTAFERDPALERLLQPDDVAATGPAVVVRKGRENYLCWLNLEEAAGRLAAQPANTVALGLITRWAAATRSGELTGGDLPGWLSDIAGRGRVQSLADRRGECIYSACPHYKRCFIERSVRDARHARIVIANHALVLYWAARGTDEDSPHRPLRYVFDEGHHLFDAADSTFAARLSAQESADLRRWLLGAEKETRSRARGLARRIEDLIAGDDKAQRALDRAQHAGRALPGAGWLKRLAEAAEQGPAEQFFAAIRRQVMARAGEGDIHYAIETTTLPADGAVLETAQAFAAQLIALKDPLTALARLLLDKLDNEAEILDSDARHRIEGLARGIERRAAGDLSAWTAMLQHLVAKAMAASADAPFDGEAEMPDQTSPWVDWFELDRSERGEHDVAYCRHWIDPTRPLAEMVLKPAHGIVMTSATLTDGAENDVEGWRFAETRAGIPHMPMPAIRAQVRSPFDFATQARVFLITDVSRSDTRQAAAAYRTLFDAAGGGALGIFTAIKRLRAVHADLAPALSALGLALYAQHVDGMDMASLIGLFRAERDACLLGTDAIRDGVDVPGESLRLVVFDRVPWPRPSILHKARRAATGRHLDDQLVRLRLRQAFGRLIRRRDDRGVFVMLDRAMPSRLLRAFPETVPVERLGLSDAAQAVRQFLSNAEG